MDIEAKRKYQREWARNKYSRTNTPEKNRKRHLKQVYGLSVEEFESMLLAQGGGCAVCGSSDGDGTKRLHIDHDHATKKIRGILCGKCNRALGLLQDDPKLIQKLLAYIVSFQ